MSQSHGASRYIPMTYFDSIADARKTLRENSLLALETQIDLLDWLHTQQSLLAYQSFMQVYGYRKIEDAMQRSTLGSWLRDRVKSVVSTAPTYYVSSDMCEMVRMAAEELPPLGLSPKDLPSPSGFLMFSRPMTIMGIGVDADTETMPISITAVAWEDGQVGHPEQGVQPGVSYWLFMNPNDAAVQLNRTLVEEFRRETGQEVPEPIYVEGHAGPGGGPIGELVTETEIREAQGPLPPYDFSGWTYGTLWSSVKVGDDFVMAVPRHEHEPRNEEGQRIGVIDEDGTMAVHPVVDQARRLMLATWKMLQEKITVLDEERPPRFIRRRAERRMPETGDIVVVRLRKETQGTLIVENPEEGPWWNHRWMVRGHWHHYWVGPKDGEQSQVVKWVAPYVKGPEGAPLVLKEKVFSLER